MGVMSTFLSKPPLAKDSFSCDIRSAGCTSTPQGGWQVGRELWSMREHSCLEHSAGESARAHVRSGGCCLTTQRLLLLGAVFVVPQNS